METDIILLVNNYLEKDSEGNPMVALINLTQVGMFSTEHISQDQTMYRKGWYIRYHANCYNGLAMEWFATKEEMMKRIIHIQNVLNIKARI